MTPKTGWPPGMLQDDDRRLSRWLASRPGARHQVRKNIMEMTDKQTGGPAFPSPELRGVYTEFGMTLRDYFAAQAMQMLRSDLSAEWCAARAYEKADAMLEARK